MTDSVIDDWQTAAPRPLPTAPPAFPARTGRRVRIWDLPTRLFHWSLAASVTGALVTPHLGDTAMPWHVRCGQAVLALVLFRLAWGVVGTRHARFRAFVKGPASVIAYLRGNGSAEQAKSSPGHNPLGALSVLAMLGIVLLQAASGLLSNDDIASEGPLAHLIDKDLSDRISQLHAHVTPTLIYALMALHVLAIVGYKVVRRQNLVTPMITGDKTDVAPEQAVSDDRLVQLRAAVCLAVSAGIVWCLSTL